jgi:hypothetical protein
MKKRGRKSHGYVGYRKKYFPLIRVRVRVRVRG